MQVADLKANSVSRFFAAREAPPSMRGDVSSGSGPGMPSGSYGRRGVTSALPLDMELKGKGGSREEAIGISIRDALSYNIRECASHQGIYSDTHTLDALVAHAARILPGLGPPAALPALSLIRVDAEGLDGAVIQGAMGLINSQNPVVIFEAEYRDAGNVSHFAQWERTMAEYSPCRLGPSIFPHCETVTSCADSPPAKGNAMFRSCFWTWLPTCSPRSRLPSLSGCCYATRRRTTRATPRFVQYGEPWRCCSDVRAFCASFASLHIQLAIWSLYLRPQHPQH
jgi:hypothetical protein